jgi:hypothetical protein
MALAALLQAYLVNMPYATQASFAASLRFKCRRPSMSFTACKQRPLTSHIACPPPDIVENVNNQEIPMGQMLACDIQCIWISCRPFGDKIL